MRIDLRHGLVRAGSVKARGKIAGRAPTAVAVGVLGVSALLSMPVPGVTQSLIPVAHVYHNHMPNFWPYFGNNTTDILSKYNALAVGAPIQYTYDGAVINLKNNPPAGYPYYLPSSVGTGPMPHDDIVSYYSANAKYQDYQSYPPNQSGTGWPMQTSELMQSYSGGSGQVHVTFSGALTNNVNSLELTDTIPTLYDEGSSWNSAWLNDYNNLLTTDGFHTMDMIHFTAHHCLGPMVGSDFFLKDLITQGATQAQPFFLGSSYQSSHGFFPTELSFSERLIPTLAKMGISWAVMGDNHFSHALQDYPYATYDATGDCLISPPNRADLQDTSNVGAWVANGLTNQSQVIVNKFPFASTPHYVRAVDPSSGAQYEVAGIPVSENGEWAEGYLCSVTDAEYQPYVGDTSRQQFYVIAHDGDNASGCSGALNTWENGVTVTGASSNGGYNLGIDEYLKKYPIPSTDVQHVQDGSWPDVLDASTDPYFYHWHLPPMIWSSQFSAFNTATGLNLAPKKNLKGTTEGGTFSLEDGWHYQERNYALLQAPLNWAKTAEQIWLGNNPNYWSPQSTLDKQVTYPGNQLNPWMIAAPVKGDPNNNYAGGANPAELAWYFLLPSMDSGFGYYGENEDDDVKPTLAFNNSLTFSQPYVYANLSQDKTGPSVWWPQRYPYNPGSVNGSKAEGWTIQWYNNNFVIYTYAYDVSGIQSVNLMVRTHSSNTINASDDTFKVYNPSALQGTSGLNITPSNVSAWTSYPMNMRDYRPAMNGVSWVPTDQATMAVLPAQEIGNIYYCYLNQYKNQLIDYYIQATDTRGNVTNSDIQTVMVGAGTYNTGGNSGYTESPTGTIAGTNPFITEGTLPAQASTPSISPNDGTFTAAQTVTMADSTPGSTIYYTTDGSYPTTSSNKYTAPITVGNSTVFRAIAVASGYTNSNFIARSFVISGTAQQASTPAISPVAGSYTTAQTVTISDGTAGATIYYTTNGTTPTTSSTVYSGPITVSSSETIEAMATAPNFSNSSAASATYTINSNSGGGSLTGTATDVKSTTQVNLTNLGTSDWADWGYSSAGTFNHKSAGNSQITNAAVVGSGSFAQFTDSIQPMTWSDGTPNASVSNTPDGIWIAGVGDGFAITAPADTNARTLTVYVGGYQSVGTLTASLSDNSAAAYTDSSMSGTATGTDGSHYYGVYTLAYKAASAGQTITVEWTENANQGSSGNVTLQAATLTGGSTPPPSAATPTFSPAAGAYASVQSVSISDATPGATIYYTTNGTTPTTSSTVYSGPISVGVNETVEAIATASVYTTSAVGNAAYTINLPAAATPTFSPAAGTYSSAQTVTLSDTTTGSTIYYTTDGSTPTTASTKYTAPITVSSTETVKAIATASGFSTSSVGSAAYTISTGTVAVTFEIQNANTTFGQNLYVVGNIAQLGNWAPGSGFPLTIQGSGANVPWKGTINLPANTTFQYKYVKWDGSTAAWESGNNRQQTTPASGSVTYNDGNF